MRILNFGSCNIDYVYSLDHIVAPGETETTHKFEIFPGGKGLNQSIAVARAGAKVFHAGCVGGDGDILTDVLKDSGVDISLLSRTDGKNGHAVIQVSRYSTYLAKRSLWDLHSRSMTLFLFRVRILKHLLKPL